MEEGNQLISLSYKFQDTQPKFTQDELNYIKKLRSELSCFEFALQMLNDPLIDTGKYIKYLGKNLH